MTVVDPSYLLHHPAEVLAIVERLRREHRLTTVEFGDGHAIVSSILEVRRDTGVLIFDIARDADQNRRLFASSSLSFVTELDHIRISFETGAASTCTVADGPAAVVALPDLVARLQRREWFRAELPGDPPIRCTVLDDHGNASPARTLDLSEGGAALLVDDTTARDAKPGSDHELILSLPEVGPVALEATLRTVGPSPGSSKIRMGFRFEGVPPKTASRIQRYVQRLEAMQLRAHRTRG